MIKIISETTFGYWNGTYVEPKTKDSEPFELDKEREEELVANGIAVFVYDKKSEPETEDNTQDLESLHADSESYDEVVDGFEVTLENLENLKLGQLKEVAAQFGVAYKVGIKKTDFAKEVYNVITAITNDKLENEDSNEEPPQFDPTDAIV